MQSTVSLYIAETTTIALSPNIIQTPFSQPLHAPTLLPSPPPTKPVRAVTAPGRRRGGGSTPGRTAPPPPPRTAPKRTPAPRAAEPPETPASVPQMDTRSATPARPLCRLLPTPRLRSPHPLLRCHRLRWPSAAPAGLPPCFPAVVWARGSGGAPRASHSGAS
ncbi:unnamed protein product [Closterium sp. NIES-54]